MIAGPLLAEVAVSGCFEAGPKADFYGEYPL